MKAIIRFLEGLVDAVILNPAMTGGEANDALRNVTNGISNAEASAWYDDLQIIYQGVGLINNATWPAFRNQIVNDGDVAAKNMASMAAKTIEGTLSMSDVNLALRNKNTEDELDAIKADIITVRAAKNSETDPAIKTALIVGLNALKIERDNLQQNVDNQR